MGGSLKFVILTFALLNSTAFAEITVNPYATVGGRSPSGASAQTLSTPTPAPVVIQPTPQPTTTPGGPILVPAPWDRQIVLATPTPAPQIIQNPLNVPVPIVRAR